MVVKICLKCGHPVPGESYNFKKFCECKNPKTIYDLKKPDSKTKDEENKKE